MIHAIKLNILFYHKGVNVVRKEKSLQFTKLGDYHKKVD